MPQNLRLKLTGVSGECQVLFSASDRATGYQVQTSADPNAGPWVDACATGAFVLGAFLTVKRAKVRDAYGIPPLGAADFAGRSFWFHFAVRLARLMAPVL